MVTDMKKRCWKGYAPVKGKKPYSKGSCRKVRRNPARQPDEAIARELYLFIENDEILLTRRYPQYILNLERKMKRGVYDREKAVKLFMYLADEASKRYSKQFGDGKTHTADVPTRMLLAKMLRDRFESERKAMGIPVGAMPRINPSPSAARLRRQAEIMEMDERLVPSTMTYEDIKDDPKLIAYYKKIMTPMAWKQLVDDWIRSGVTDPARRGFVIPKQSEYQRMVSQNPPPLFKSGGYIVVKTYTGGRQEFTDHIETLEEARKFRKYFLEQNEKSLLYRGRTLFDSVEILPHTEVLRNPAQSDPNLAYKKEYGWTFVEFLKKRLIPDLRESGMYATIADYQRGISLYNDKKGVLPITQFTNYLKYLRETLIPDLKESGSDSTAADFERMYKMVLYTMDRQPKSRDR
jgi:hypothetical protein